MPPLLIAAAVTTAGTVYASSQANSANKKALNAQTAASDKQLALQEQQYNQTRQDNAPYRTSGYGALNALDARLGVGGSGPQAGQPDYAAYVAQNPDIQAEAAKVIAEDPQSIGDLNGDGTIDATDYGINHAKVFHDRPVPTAQGQGAQQTSQGALQQQIGAEPTFGPRQNYERPAYQQADVGIDKFQASPDYNFRLQEGSRNLNAFNAAKGALGSGAAMKALVDYGQNTAASEYGNWRSYVTGQTDKANAFNQDSFNSDRGYGTDIYNTDRANSLNRFDANRSYYTSQDNNQTNNLFKLAAGGQNAVGQTSAAGSDYANNSGNIIQNNANAVSNAFGQTAQNNAGLAGSLTGLGQSLANAFGGSSKYATKSTPFVNNAPQWI